MRAARKRLAAIEKGLGPMTNVPVGPPIELTEAECRVLANVQARMEEDPGKELDLSEEEMSVLEAIRARMGSGGDAR